LIFRLDILPGGRPSSLKKIPTTALAEFLEHSRSGSSSLAGQFILVQEITPDLVGILGSALNIEPLLFAEHLSCARNERTTVKGVPNGLPLAASTGRYYSFRYYAPIVLGRDVPPTARLLCYSYVRRIVGIMHERRATNDDQCVAFVARRFSTLLCQRENGTWLCE
jgi:hypothetical protein